MLGTTIGEAELVTGRPEGDSRDYQASDSYDPHAWQEFTDWRPWRPGDPSPHEAPIETTSRYADGQARYASGRDEEGYRGTGSRGAESTKPADHSGRRWNEAVPRRFEAGDQVRNQHAVGDIVSHVQPGTRGEVLSTRQGLLGGDFVTVRFENGYTEEVRTEDLDRRGWLD